MQDSGKVKVLSTISQIGDLVSYVGGENIDSLVLVPGDLDPHSYELVKGDGEKMARADLIFYNGLGLEHGASLSAILETSPKSVALGNGVQREYPDLILEKDRVIDPHLWMDLSLWSKTVDTIVKNLKEKDSANASLYEMRGDLLKKEMLIRHENIKNTLHKIPAEKRYLVTSHDAFRYFARGYLKEEGETDWENRFTAPEGLAPDGQLSPLDMHEVIEFLQKHEIGVLFPESNINPTVVTKIAKTSQEMGYQVRLCTTPLYGDSTSGLSYFDAMEKNAELLVRELGH